MEFRPVHLCIIQPLGYVHSLGFLDQARYLRYQFRRFGVDVTIAKNRLKHGAVNVVLGAHLGFDPELRKRYACIFFNLEQMGEGARRCQMPTVNCSGHQQFLITTKVIHLITHPMSRMCRCCLSVMLPIWILLPLR